MGEIKNRSEREDLLFQSNISADNIRETPDRFLNLLEGGIDGEFEYCDFRDNLVNIRCPLISKDKYWTQKDIHSKYINIINGRRVTAYQPAEYKNTIHIFGPSWAFGLYVNDENTIPSHLQKLVNIHWQPYKVVNYGVLGLPLEQLFDYMNDTLIREGDIVLFLYNDRMFEEVLKQCGFSVINFTESIHDPRSHGEIFIDCSHLNGKGNELMAEQIYHNCIEPGSLQKNRYTYFTISKKQICWTSYIRNELEDELEDYLERLPNKVDAEKIGSIVMNCNPFTKGHRYLIEIAASRVDILYIFVVQENKSVFPFEDRYQLVVDGTKDLQNVVVLPSGKFIISSFTFPGYFVKGDNKEAVIDASDDLLIFAKRIAPRLGITIRFAGSEPIDKVTRQYNQQMAKILPEYGISFKEITRMNNTDTGEIISASYIRKLIAEENYEKLKTMVPDVTYKYLIKNKEIKERLKNV